ncbi:MAG: hypothetical protein LBU05_01095, partial [Bifidobacteriaceae bacterium]|nr:hypothetical protein [Bifidobacteriaceae bacterium]
MLQTRGSNLWFRYGDRYLDDPRAVSLYGPELPLGRNWVGPGRGLGHARQRASGACRGSVDDYFSDLDGVEGGTVAEV